MHSDSRMIKLLKSHRGKTQTASLDRDVWSFAAQMGDSFASQEFGPHRLALRLIADKRKPLPYSALIEQLSFVFRVDGDLAAWHFEGCERLRINRKGRYITVDIGVPESRWHVKDEAQLRAYVADCVRQGAELMITKLERDRIEVDGERLRRDLDAILRDYQARKWPKHPNLW